jgi:RNA polymerase sigma factor (sigma-70 family)
MAVVISDHLLEHSARQLDSEPDEHLVSLAQMGHEAAFSAIVRRYEPELLAQARRLSSDGRGEDAVQQAFLNAFAALRAGREVRHLRGWLHQILRNVLIRSRVPVDVPLEVGLADGESLEETVQRRAQAHATLVQLSALPDRQRDALMGTAVHGFPRAHVAATMGLSEGAVRQLVHRARRRLREAAAALLPFPFAKMFGAARPGVDAPPDAALGAGAAASGGVAIKVGTLVASGVVATSLAVTQTFPTHHRGAVGGGGHRHAVQLRAARHVTQAPASHLAVAPAAAGVHRVSVALHAGGGGPVEGTRAGQGPGRVHGRNDGRGHELGARSGEGSGRSGSSGHRHDDGSGGASGPTRGSGDDRGSGATSGRSGSGATSGHSGSSFGSGAGAASTSGSPDDGPTSSFGQATSGHDGSGSSGSGLDGGGGSGAGDPGTSSNSGSTAGSGSGSNSVTETGDRTSGDGSGSSGSSVSSGGSGSSGLSGTSGSSGSSGGSSSAQPLNGGSGSDGGSKDSGGSRDLSGSVSSSSS